MPLPLVPAILIGASAVAGAKGFIDTITGIEMLKKAQQRYQRRRERYEAHAQRYRDKHRKTQQRLEYLGALRLQSMQTLGAVVAFLDRARLTTQPAGDQVVVARDELVTWRGLAVPAQAILHTLGTSVGAGVGAASAIYSLAGAVGTASTGTAIASLSGAAATDAALAWLGGGALAAGGGGIALGTAVIGGLVAGPAVLVSGFFIATQADKVRTAVLRQCAEMDVAEAKMERQIVELLAIRERAAEVSASLIRLDAQVQELLLHADPAQPEDVFAVVQVARALAVVVAMPALDRRAPSTRTGKPQ